MNVFEVAQQSLKGMTPEQMHRAIGNPQKRLAMVEAAISASGNGEEHRVINLPTATPGPSSAETTQTQTSTQTVSTPGGEIRVSSQTFPITKVYLDRSTDPHNPTAVIQTHVPASETVHRRSRSRRQSTLVPSNPNTQETSNTERIKSSSRKMARAKTDGSTQAPASSLESRRALPSRPTVVDNSYNNTDTNGTPRSADQDFETRFQARQDEQFVRLREELRQEIADLIAENVRLQAENARLQVENDQLRAAQQDRNDTTTPTAVVSPTTPQTVAIPAPAQQSQHLPNLHIPPPIPPQIVNQIDERIRKYNEANSAGKRNLQDDRRGIWRNGIGPLAAGSFFSRLGSFVIRGLNGSTPLPAVAAVAAGVGSAAGSVYRGVVQKEDTVMQAQRYSNTNGVVGVLARGLENFILQRTSDVKGTKEGYLLKKVGELKKRNLFDSMSSRKQRKLYNQGLRELQVYDELVASGLLAETADTRNQRADTLSATNELFDRIYTTAQARSEGYNAINRLLTNRETGRKLLGSALMAGSAAAKAAGISGILELGSQLYAVRNFGGWVQEKGNGAWHELGQVENDSGLGQTTTTIADPAQTSSFQGHDFLLGNKSSGLGFAQAQAIKNYLGSHANYFYNGQGQWIEVNNLNLADVHDGVLMNNIHSAIYTDPTALRAYNQDTSNILSSIVRDNPGDPMLRVIKGAGGKLADVQILHPGTQPTTIFWDDKAAA